ncbi:hypothetical protein MTR_3g018960 [Medicago truncatula]|uniref:Uncharacterized protein n=1 Tax=Medicago truncatula TaxID=3880 RepID=G7IW22_MEDTR|nr:hypothetical protein MTR_3g018960 [Medicago truncatula]
MFFPNRATIDAYDPKYDQPYPENLAQQAKNRVTIGRPENQLSTLPKLCHDFSASQLCNLKTYTTVIMLAGMKILERITTKKTKFSEGNIVRENVKSLSNSVTKFCDQGICEEFHFFRH